ncbi:MAG: ABC transporter ATP-binding protein [Bacteriovoracaceae bacterium]
MKLQTKNLKKSYGNGAQSLSILKEVDFDLASGQVAAIIGQSGSGKTTLLSLLAGLDNPDTGSIFYDDVDVTKLSEKDLTEFRAQNLSIVFQQFHLMPYLSALENVALPLQILKRENALKLAEDALQKVGLSHRLSHLPSELSGGECQRVAIARAFVTSPKILLADEPSGNLDTKTGEEVMELLFNLVKEKKTTLVLVTHNQDLAAKCEVKFKLVEGILNRC